MSDVRRSAIDAAISKLEANNHQPSDGKWLEQLTVDIAPHIRDWDVEACWLWSEWPEREAKFSNSIQRDIGIDAVAKRHDGRYVAIQCKAHKLDETGQGYQITKREIDSFASATGSDFWQERWVVTNGDNGLAQNAQQITVLAGNPVKLINLSAEVRQQSDMLGSHSSPDDEVDDSDAPSQSKDAMQADAISTAVRILREHERSDSGGLPVGQARGKIILPCGTGKTRIALRIVEELTAPGETSIVLCPSIALVAQIRREFLNYANANLSVLGVCSDETAGYDPKKEESRVRSDDPTLDTSNVSVAEVKGTITTDANQIASWIEEGRDSGKINVIFGTYQSGHRVASALLKSGTTAQVLIADEAHRTAGLKKKRRRNANGEVTPEEQRLRDFTLCHDNDNFPARYRIYQTATPRIYDTKQVRNDRASDWVVRSMDDESIFGVELYRKSYYEAVTNGWLSDYRIIALGVNDPDAYQAANELASNTESKGRNKLSTTHYLRGLAFALAMGGGTVHDGNTIPIKSCIAFMNTVDRSKNMARDLQTKPVRDWLKRRMLEENNGHSAAEFQLRHLDATSNVSARDHAKQELAEADTAAPRGILNVGIFGEGTDSPSLSSVAFLEPRKSPIDVIQAVGRAMRIAPGKEMGYIICPILIPPNVDPEDWLSTSEMDEGWQELGQILLALRAHDQRIEDELEDLMIIQTPQTPEKVRHIVAIAREGNRQISYREHIGTPGEARRAVERVLKDESRLNQEFTPIVGPSEVSAGEANGSLASTTLLSDPGETFRAATIEPTQIMSGKRNSDGSIEIRVDSVARKKPKPDGTIGEVDIAETKAKARKMISEGTGRTHCPRGPREPGEPRPGEEPATAHMQRVLNLRELKEVGENIKANLLEKSGLTGNRVIRDLNILEQSVKEAAHALHSDELVNDLNRYFQLDNLREQDRKKQADGCTIAALLLMNAAMLHQRIANGSWIPAVSDLEAVKNDVNVVRRFQREWNAIMVHDFEPVLKPAVEAIYAIEDTGKLGGLERALRSIAAEAERIAETYADMGADHAGPLFNRVMGNQASDGAFFTRPVAASIAARLTLDACGEQDWTDPAVWRAHKSVDLACGSGTLLAALLTEMKRRAREQGASDEDVNQLQRIAVEETIKGLDINPVSLQLAASQLTAGNHEIAYSRMGLHLMPYGPSKGDPNKVSAGSLELLGQRAIVERSGQFDLDDDEIESQTIWPEQTEAEIEKATDAVGDAGIIIMNPPFTNRAKMGEKFPKEIQQTLRARADSMEQVLVQNDEVMDDFVDKNSIRPLFVGLAEKICDTSTGLIAMIVPTIALTAPSGLQERRILARRFHVHTILTCHQPGNVNLSQNTGLNESLVILQRKGQCKRPTRFINLDKFPFAEQDAGELHDCLKLTNASTIQNGWGEIAEWPTERIQAGDWTPAIWRSPELAQAAAEFSDDLCLRTIREAGLSPLATGQLLRGSFERAEDGLPHSFPILKSKSAEAQTTIRSQPDEWWVSKRVDQETRKAEAERMQSKTGYLLITAGQNTATGRLAATADAHAYVGNGWMPVVGLSAVQAKALSVFVNSTVGRLQLMRNPGRTLLFPTYSTREAANIRIPDIKDERVIGILADCWERTKDMVVPQYRDGDTESEVRILWDEAVAEAIDMDADYLAHLRNLLHREPHVRGLGYNQYADEAEE